MISPWSVPQVVSVFTPWWQQLVQNVMFITQHTVKQCLVRLSEQFYDGRSVRVAESESLTAPQERVESIAVGRQTKTGPCWSSVQQFGHDGGLEHSVERMSCQSVCLERPQRVQISSARSNRLRHVITGRQTVVYMDAEHRHTLDTRGNQKWIR